jgi:hypothetical protein
VGEEGVDRNELVHGLNVPPVVISLCPRQYCDL